jgi:hypothetical protein
VHFKLCNSDQFPSFNLWMAMRESSLPWQGRAGLVVRRG